MQKKGLTPEKSMILTDSILNEGTSTKKDVYPRKFSPDRYTQSSKDNQPFDKMDKSIPDPSRKSYYDNNLRNTNPVVESQTRDRIQRMDVNQESIYDFQNNTKPKADIQTQAAR